MVPWLFDLKNLKQETRNLKLETRNFELKLFPFSLDLDLRLRPDLDGHFFNFKIGGFDAV